MSVSDCTDFVTCGMILLNFYVYFYPGAVVKTPNAMELKFKTKSDGYVSNF